MFSMWHVNCQVSSLHLVEHETCVFSRAWLKRDLRVNFERTTCDNRVRWNTLFRLFTFCLSLQFLCWTKSLHVHFLSSFLCKFWRGQIVPLAVFLRDNFNYSAGLVQWRGLAQNPHRCYAQIISEFSVFCPVYFFFVGFQSLAISSRPWEHYGCAVSYATELSTLPSSISWGKNKFKGSQFVSKTHCYFSQLKADWSV